MWISNIQLINEIIKQRSEQNNRTPVVMPYGVYVVYAILSQPIYIINIYEHSAVIVARNKCMLL